MQYACFTCVKKNRRPCPPVCLTVLPHAALQMFPLGLDWFHTCYLLPGRMLGSRFASVRGAGTCLEQACDRASLALLANGVFVLGPSSQLKTLLWFGGKSCRRKRGRNGSRRRLWGGIRSAPWLRVPGRASHRFQLLLAQVSSMMEYAPYVVVRHRYCLGCCLNHSRKHQLRRKLCFRPDASHQPELACFFLVLVSLLVDSQWTL